MVGHGGRRKNQTGRPRKWGKRLMWGVWLPVELAKAAEVFRHRDGASQSELVTRALVELLKGASDGNKLD